MNSARSISFVLSHPFRTPRLHYDIVSSKPSEDVASLKDLKENFNELNMRAFISTTQRSSISDTRW